MRETLRDPSRIIHMIQAIHNVNEYMNGKNQADLDNNSMLFYAVVKNIEIIGEAAYKLTQEFRDAHPQTPWRQIIGMRHILVHGYYQVESSEIFNLFVEDLPILLQQLEGYIENENGVMEAGEGIV